MGEFKESEHPRDKDGKFTDKGITTSSNGNNAKQRLKNVLKTYSEQIHFYRNINELTEQLNSTPEKAKEIMTDAIKTGKINLKLREQKQRQHIEGTLEYKQAVKNGKSPSILTQDANKLIKIHAGKGQLLFNKGKWTQTERFMHDGIIGEYINNQKGKRYKTQNGRIHYSNKGVHIVPDGKDRKNK